MSTIGVLMIMIKIMIMIMTMIITWPVDCTQTSEVTLVIINRSLCLTFLGHGYGQIWWSLRPSVQPCLLFVSWQLDHLGRNIAIFQIWPWKFKVKVMATVKPDCRISGVEFNRYACYLFHGNRTIFGWNIANTTSDHGNSRLRSWPKSNPMVTFEA